MKKFIFSFLLCFALSEVNGQVNLVPNFSFEEYSDCPISPSLIACQVDLAVGWSSYSEDNTTPDYFNACAPVNEFGVPQNRYFYQPDNRNCGAYMGLGTFVITGLEREHIGIQLAEPLIIGQKYYLSFYTVMGEVYSLPSGGDIYGMPSNNISLRLSTVPYSEINPAPIDNFAHLRSESIITDTVNWTLISGSIIADSVYKYVILGNFYNDDNTDTIHYNCANCTNYASYYLVDDVCISTDSSFCNGGVDALPCTVSIIENSFFNSISIFPNPTNDFVTISTDFQNAFDIEVYNTIGQLLYLEKNIVAADFQLDVSPFNYDLLFIKITSQNNQLTYKLLKQ
jgi:hypothetical protein